MNKFLQYQIRLRKCQNEMDNLLLEDVKTAAQERSFGNYDGAIRFSNSLRVRLKIYSEMELRLMRRVSRDIQEVYFLCPPRKEILKVMKKAARNHYRNSQTYGGMIKHIEIWQKEVIEEQISNQS